MKKTVVLIIVETVLLAVIATAVISAYNTALADTYYIMCDPESHVNARNTPRKDAEVVGRWECGDRIETDGRTQNGYVHVIDCPFEQPEAWVKAWYLTEYHPRIVSMTTVVMKNRTIARNGIGGTVKRRLNAGAAVTILVYTPEWCLTNRGYIQTAFLGVNR